MRTSGLRTAFQGRGSKGRCLCNQASKILGDVARQCGMIAPPARLASSHEPGDESPCIPRQIAGRSSTKHGDGRFTEQTERKESERRRPRFLNRSPQLGVTIFAIRHLLACAVFLRQTTRSFLFEWINWRIRHNEIARKNPLSKAQKNAIAVLDNISRIGGHSGKAIRSFGEASLV
jgi:hypothetical protein